MYLLGAGLLPFLLVLLVELFRRHHLETFFAHHFWSVCFHLETTALARNAHQILSLGERLGKHLIGISAEGEHGQRPSHLLSVVTICTPTARQKHILRPVLPGTVCLLFRSLTPRTFRLLCVHFFRKTSKSRRVLEALLV